MVLDNLGMHQQINHLLWSLKTLMRLSVNPSSRAEYQLDTPLLWAVILLVRDCLQLTLDPFAAAVQNGK